MVHRCFKSSYETAIELNNAIYYAYKNFYDRNSLETDFGINNPGLLKELYIMKK